MRSFIVVALFVMSFPLPSGAQGLIQLSGKVIDYENGASLGYATVSLKARGVGTVSNADGDFEFHIQDKHLHDTLCVSMLGYAKYQNVVDAIDPSVPLIVRLKISPILLSEVVIKGDTISANSIFKKAYENLTKTFPQELYELKGFYRQINTENEKNVFLVEAAVDIYDKSYHLKKNFKLDEKVFVNEVRWSNSLFKNTDENYFEKSNTLTWLMLFNYSRYNNHFVMERTNFHLDSVVNYNQRLYYIISSAVGGIRLRNKFTLYIDTENFSFLKIKNESVANKGYYLQNFDVPVDREKTKILRLIATSQSYRFKEYKGKMYLESAIAFSKGQIINTTNNSVAWSVTDQNELVINEIITDREIPTPKKGLMDNGKNLKFLKVSYNSVFWNHNLINLTPLTKRQKEDLEAVKPLKEQFIQNGNKK